MCCQFGAEAALKAEVAIRYEQLRFAYSRPGFVTFKVPADVSLSPDANWRLTFARSVGFSIGQLRGEDAVELGKQLTFYLMERQGYAGKDEYRKIIEGHD